jgi:hypothetical protein
MTQFSTGDPAKQREEPMPRRDWVLVPVVSLFTICFVLISTDILARIVFPRSETASEDCMVFNDPLTGPRGIPNSVCREKNWESEVTEYRFNSFGYRTDLEPEPKRSNSYRIVMIGSSFAVGARVPIEKTLAVLLPAELSRRLGKDVELYNESLYFLTPRALALHFKQVLAAKPDMILWVLTPYDVWNPTPPKGLKVSHGHSAYEKVKVFLGDFWPRLSAELHDHSLFMLQHFMWLSQSLSTTSYLADRPNEPFLMGPAFLRVKSSAEWQRQLGQFDGDAASIEAQARDAHVPLVAFLFPFRSQAAMISKGEWPEGSDPFKLGRELRSIILSHGGAYINILPDFRGIPSAEQGFFPVDGHPNALGHALVAAMLTKAFTQGALPSLKVNGSESALLEQGR